MDGRDFLTLTEQLVVTQHADEKHFRSAVSRAYYGAFHFARELLDQLGFPAPRSASGHGVILRRLMNCGNGDVAEAGGMLDTMRSDRNAADYDLHDGKFGKRANAQTRIEQAHEILRILGSCSTEPIRSQVVDGIRDYESRFTPK